MSLYSYIMSFRKRRDFREPKLLSKLLGGRAKGASLFAGWVIHYAVGVFFSAVYSGIWKKSRLSPLLSSPVFGLITGGVAVAGWEATIRSHPFYPFFGKSEFYRQLIVAHVIFCVSIAIMYQQQAHAPQQEKNNDDESSIV